MLAAPTPEIRARCKRKGAIPTSERAIVLGPMSRDDAISTISPLDRAYADLLAGDSAKALRRALPLLEEEGEQLGTAALIARVLVEQSRPFVAGEVAKRLVDAFCRRGDLPAAVVVAKTADAAGEDRRALLQDIAGIFGLGSARVADVPQAPPPLPKGEPKVLPESVGLDALLERAESALEAFLQTDDTVAADAPVPRLPLFSKLDPELLVELLLAFEIRDYAEGEVLIQQGDEGREAFVVARGALRVLRDAGQESETTLAALGPGAIFGEMALVSDTPRAATVEAAEAAIVLCAERDTLEKLAQREPAIGQELGAFCRGRMVANVIRHSAVLSKMPASERLSLVNEFQTRGFEPGETLIERDKDVDGLYLVASGRVSVVGVDSDGDQIQIASLGAGEVVGEISLVLRRPATAEVRAAEPTVALWLERAAFKDAIREHPALLGELYETATQREEETRSVVAQEACDADDIILL